ncbi:O-antigen ligase family protein [Enterococcus rotai]|uniref:O-antigen ligase family protein n=1 Tax=Enterococcus rotai TaxID=118060 RepID=UPI0032B408AF
MFLWRRLKERRDKVENNNDTKQLFFYFFSLFPLVDLLNGYLLSINHGLPVGTAYRLVLLGWIVMILLKEGVKKHSSLALVAFINVVIFSLLNLVQALFFSHSVSQIMTDFTALSKYFLWLGIALVFSEHIQEKKQLEKLVVRVNTFFSAGVIIPYVLGIGNFTYSNSKAGYKSFFFATNDLTYAFVILSTLLSFYLITQFSREKSSYFIFLTLLYGTNLICMLLIGTKSGIGYGVVNLLVAFIYLIFIKSSISYNFKFFLIQTLLILLLFFLVIGKDMVLSVLDGVIDRMSYFYKVYEGNWVKILSSSRSIYLEDAYTGFLKYPLNYCILWFGFGAANRWSLFGRHGGYIEMDFFDTLFSYGFIGLALLIVSLVYLVIKCKKEQGDKRYLYLFFVSLVYAFLTGHVFYSAMSSMIFGLVISGMFITKERKVEE